MLETPTSNIFDIKWGSIHYDTKVELKNYGHFSNVLVKVRDKYFSYTRSFKYNKLTYTQPIEVVPCEKTIVVQDWKPVN